MEFIRAKRENGRLRQFNLSLLITDEFMQAVEERRRVEAGLPARAARNSRPSSRDLDDAAQVRVARMARARGYVANEEGLVACKIYKTLPARRMWDVIMSSTYDFAEPGFILIDRVNEMNNNWWCENIRATNPCGEQPLAAVRLVPAGLGESHALRASIRSPTMRASIGRISRGGEACSRACSTTWSRSTACRWSSSATRSCASAATAWASSAWAPPSPCWA